MLLVTRQVDLPPVTRTAFEPTRSQPCKPQPSATVVGLGLGLDLGLGLGLGLGLDLWLGFLTRDATIHTNVSRLRSAHESASDPRRGFAELI